MIFQKMSGKANLRQEKGPLHQNEIRNEKERRTCNQNITHLAGWNDHPRACLSRLLGTSTPRLGHSAALRTRCPQLRKQETTLDKNSL